jgi:long-subunit acyl-CoA synthetase (AMP-forming)
MAEPSPVTIPARARSKGKLARSRSVAGLSIVCTLRADEHDATTQTGLARLRSCGKPVPGAEVETVADDGTVCGAGELGEVRIRSDFVMNEYWNDPGRTSETLRDGWLYSGDIGRVDEDGYLYIVDRKKDLIISGGQNIVSKEIEDALYEFPGVLEAAAIGVPDEEWGERVHAFVSFTASTRPLETGSCTRFSLSGWRRSSDRERLRCCPPAAEPPEDAQQLTEQIEQTREQLGETVQALAAKADVTATAQEKASQLTAGLKDRAEQVKQQASQAQRQLADQTAPARQQLASVGQTAKDQVQQVGATARQRRKPVAIALGAATAAVLAIVWWRRR